MARKETIVNSAWTTDLLPLAHPAKLVFIWSWTNLAASLCGIYEIQRMVIEFETDVRGNEMDEVLTALAAEDRMHYDGQWLYVPARLDNINRQSPTVMKAVARDLQSVPPDHQFLAALIARYPNYVANLNKIKGVSIPSTKPDSQGENVTVSTPSFVQGQGHRQGSFNQRKGKPKNLGRQSRGLTAGQIIEADHPHLSPLLDHHEPEAVLSAVSRLSHSQHEPSLENVERRLDQANTPEQEKAA